MTMEVVATMTATEAFRDRLAACDAWGHPAVGPEWIEQVEARLPPGVRTAVARAAASDCLVTVDGHRFRLEGLAPGKGPYAFFSRSQRQVPAPNWEYFVQIAEYDRVRRAMAGADLRVDFEDELMDISVRDGGTLLWCIEVKERAGDLDALLAGITSYAGVADDAPDRGNDALRKAKYLQRQRPPWFSLVGIGRRLDFSVEHGGGAGFRLVPDVVPVG